MQECAEQKTFKDLYTSSYVQRQLEKFRNRHNNHWKAHLDLAATLVGRFAPPPPARMLDLGCSIGTFALEFALKGYETTGLDLDEKSLEQGKALAEELGVSPLWIRSDATKFSLDEPVDFAVCFDLLEHLFDDQIRDMLRSVHDSLRPGGVFLFHTFPTQYDHVFYRNNVFPLPLIPFRNLSPAAFTELTRVYAGALDVYYLARKGKTWKSIIRNTVHPNPLSAERVSVLCEEAGLRLELLEYGLDSVNSLKPGQGRVAKRYFTHQPVAFRSIWGAARRPINQG
jgi:2-polyprenyl-3-methyl-5-hydroxy-6-metoxy-1,4-benzoquinol methylase